jgi:Protein of unknown function (DUF664)
VISTYAELLQDQDGKAHSLMDHSPHPKHVAERSLDAEGRHPGSGNRHSLRWVLNHMIEEYARHNGHADLIREAIDGEVGELGE